MCNLWAGSGSRLLVLGLKRKDQRCQFGFFGGGSRPLVFFRRCLLMEQLDLGLQAGARRRALSSRVASPAGFGALALLDGPGLTQFRVSNPKL